MSDFPILRTGSVLQFPASRAMEYATDVIRFADGGEQRFREYGEPLHRWIIRLGGLDEGELGRIRAFVEENGMANAFSFTDPWDGTTYPSCRIDGSSVSDRLDGPGRVSTSLVIQEYRK